jgi:hypothetical protein
MLYEQDGTVNHQITDSVTQTMAHVVGHSPSETKSMLDTLMAETIGMAMYNAVTNQHNAQMVSNATVVAACARMLKAPIAIPPVVPAVPPVIISVTPPNIPPKADQKITVVATGLQKGFSVNILKEDSTLLATLSGTEQLTYVPDSSSFTFQSDVFKDPGTYYLRIQNPPICTGSTVFSPNFKLTIAHVSPQVKSITPAGPETYHVAGSCFHPQMTATFEDDQGNPVPGATISEIRPGLVKIFVPNDAPSGPFRVTFTNPCNQKTTRLFNKAVSMMNVATVYQGCEGHESRRSGENASPEAQPKSNEQDNPGPCSGHQQ